MDPLIHNRCWRWFFLIGVVVLLLAACAMVGVGLVRVKMLPFDNKSEFQVILDMPEQATLEDTAAAALEMGDYLNTVNEVVDYQVYVGTAGPLISTGWCATTICARCPTRPTSRSTWRAKERQEQSHAIAKRVRPPLKAIAERYGARVKVAEVPPGPPVLSTLVAEVYGPDYDRQREMARKITDDFRADRRRGGCGLVHGRGPAALPGCGRSGKGGPARHQRGADHANPQDWLLAARQCRPAAPAAENRGRPHRPEAAPGLTGRTSSG